MSASAFVPTFLPPVQQETRFIGSYTRAIAENPHGETLVVRQGVVFEVVRGEVEGNANEANPSGIARIVTSGAVELYRFQYRGSGTQVIRNTQRGIAVHIGPFTTDTTIQVQTQTLASPSGTPTCAARFWLRQVKRNSQTAIQTQA